MDFDLPANPPTTVPFAACTVPPILLAARRDDVACNINADMWPREHGSDVIRYEHSVSVCLPPEDNHHGGTARESKARGRRERPDRRRRAEAVEDAAAHPLAVATECRSRTGAGSSGRCFYVC